jgi:hypothetical protein
MQPTFATVRPSSVSCVDPCSEQPGCSPGDPLSATTRLQETQTPVPSTQVLDLSQYPDSAVHVLPAHLLAGLAVLARARSYSQVAHKAPSDFAVERNRLKEAGLDDTDLRLLLSLGYVEVYEEPARDGPAGPGTHAGGRLSFTASTCFTLTESGAAHFGKLLPAGSLPENASPTPHFDRESRELRVGDRLVKRFRQPASCQETILRAFDEKGWPRVMPDPLPPEKGRCAQRRLHDTVNNLNRNQRQALIRFYVTGNGRRVGWGLVTK